MSDHRLEVEVSISSVRHFPPISLTYTKNSIDSKLQNLVDRNIILRGEMINLKKVTKCRTVYFLNKFFQTLLGIVQKILIRMDSRGEYTILDDTVLKKSSQAAITVLPKSSSLSKLKEASNVQKVDSILRRSQETEKEDSQEKSKFQDRGFI